MKIELNCYRKDKMDPKVENIKPLVHWIEPLRKETNNTMNRKSIQIQIKCSSKTGVLLNLHN